MRVLVLPVVLPGLLVAACSQPAPTGNVATVTNVVEVNETVVAAPSPEPLRPAEPGQPGGLVADKTPISEAPFAADSPQGAANVVQTYYALIGEGKYAEAWTLWGDGGKASGQTADAFVASFAKYSEYHANVGAPGREDAGAGQRYVTVPVQAYARLKDGKPAYWIGSVVLHRTADIDGATAADKTWHIKSIDLKPAPPAPK